MDERDPIELGRAPSRYFLQRIVNLHIALAVSIMLRSRLILWGNRNISKQSSVKLVRSDRANDATARLDLLAAGQ
jgi:hypothetical protein